MELLELTVLIILVRVVRVLQEEQKEITVVVVDQAEQLELAAMGNHIHTVVLVVAEDITVAVERVQAWLLAYWLWVLSG